ncbi:MAG: NAD(P)/FAD-dependent oxidoreductase [Acidobacteriota bacterium]
MIIVGARCAGSTTAMLLARRGYRVLVVDRATFPSEIISTHVVQPLAVGALARWDLLDRLAATGCPPIHTYVYDFGQVVLEGCPGTKTHPAAYCPRRTVLDKLLVDAAAEAGAEIREAFRVDEILLDDRRPIGVKGRSKGGAAIVAYGRVVIGADGRHSLVARTVRAGRYHEKPPLLAPYYAYWSGLPMHGRFETYVRPHRAFAAAATHDGLTMTIGGWPYTEFDANKKDFAGNFLRLFDLVPEFAGRLRAATRQSAIVGLPVSNFFCKPFGPGWALVGDAGYTKDPITGQGIHDAFSDAERCATALDQALSGARSFDDAMGEYQRSRDQHALPMYELTCHLATLEPPEPAKQRLLAAIQGNQEAMDAYAQMHAGTISPAEFDARTSALS